MLFIVCYFVFVICYGKYRNLCSPEIIEYNNYTLEIILHVNKWGSIILPLIFTVYNVLLMHTPNTHMGAVLTLFDNDWRYLDSLEKYWNFDLAITNGNIISYALQIGHAYISISCKKQFKGWNFAIGECGRQTISTCSLHTVIMCLLPALCPLPV